MIGQLLSRDILAKTEMGGEKETELCKEQRNNECLIKEEPKVILSVS